MKYEVTPAEKSTVKIEIVFSEEEWKEANQKAYLRSRGRYAVNGFRKGKAPKSVLELYYGKGLFYEDALNLLYAEHFDGILEKEKENFTPAGEPSLALGEDFSETNIVLVATLPVMPEVTIDRYTGIKIKKYEYTVTDADVEAEVQASLARLGKKEEVTDRPAEMGDTVTIDFEGKLGGVPFEGGTAEGHDLELGSHSFIPGFEEGVVGMNLGETRDIEVTFPEDYQEESLKGKAAVFTVTLHKIVAVKVPALSDEIAKGFHCDTAEDFCAKIRARLEQSAKNRSRNETENAIVAAIAKYAHAEIPDVLVEKQQDDILQRIEGDLMRQGISLEMYLAYLGTTREEYKKGFEASARTLALHHLIIRALIEKEKITANPEEIRQAIARQAAEVGKEPELYEKTMAPAQRDYIESDICVTKLFDFLMANNDMDPNMEEPAEEPAAEPAEALAEEAPAEETAEAPAPKKRKKKTEAEAEAPAEEAAEAPAPKKRKKKTEAEAEAPAGEAAEAPVPKKRKRKETEEQ